MRIKELKTLLASIPDEAVIVRPSEDGTYRAALVYPTEAACEQGVWSEKSKGKKIKVLVIS
jgi:hypothetical protein